MAQRMREFWSWATGVPQQEVVAAESSHTNTQKQADRPPLEVLYPSPNSSASNQTEIDIVAVHGLGSNVDWSWTWQDKEGHQVHWLRDANMLPEVVPHARIIAYRYESKWHAKAPRTRLELCGEELVNSLHSFRSDDPQRPIIFIAHSLGGLVVLHGLLYADRTEKFKYLPASTVGFAPLGTPFRGTNMQNLAKKVAWVMSPMGSNDGIITDLDPDGKHLADKVHAFGLLRDRLRIPTTCFFELYESDYGRKIGFAGFVRGMVVEEESAYIPGWGRAHLNTDHFKLNKFAGPNDPSFKTVSNELRDMCAQWKSVMEGRKQETRDPPFMVPFGRNDDFVGRDAILEQLLEKIPPGADDCKRIVVEGLGGIGKTQVALQAAYRVREAHPDCSIFWVPAISLTSFENAYRKIGQLLGLRGIDDEKADVKRLVKDGLGDKSAGSWLLIIDNADDIDILFTSANLYDYLPFSREGSILFTTRNHDVTVRLGVSQADTIVLSEMNNTEAAEMLQKNLKESQLGDAEDTRLLLDFLANLPLAIKQASAYMASNTNVTVSQYLEFCESSKADQIDLLSRHFEDRYRYRDHAKSQNPVATTWLISFEHISQHNPQAADYLKFMCLLAEKDIPLSLLPVTSKLKMVEAIGMLQAYAFIIQRDTPDSFDIHRLVRLVMRNWLGEKGEWDEWNTNVVRRLAEEYPFPNYEIRKTWTKYLPHGQAILDNGTIDLEVGGPLVSKIALSYLNLGIYSEAERLFRQIMEVTKRALGREHPDTLSTMNSLGNALQSHEKHEEAETMHRQTLGLREKVLGRKHPDTLATMSNLGNALHSQGKHEEAKMMYRQTLKLQIKVLGGGHPETLLTMNNLAFSLDSEGEPKKAEKLYRQALGLQEKVLGREHPERLMTMSNLGRALHNQGKYEEAETMQRQALGLREKMLGGEHPDTLLSMHNLAASLHGQGKYQEAETMFRQTLRLQEKVLGRQHPNALGTLNNLAKILYSQGKYEEVETMCRQMLELREKVLGREHPDTLGTVYNLANTLRKQGKYEEAEMMYRQVLDLGKVLGRDIFGTTDTLATMNDLATVLHNQGRYEEAETMYWQALGLEKVLGREHPVTLKIINNLANTLRSQGKHEEADEILASKPT